MTEERIVFTREEQDKLNKMYEQWRINDHQRKRSAFHELNLMARMGGVVFAGDSITEMYPISEMYLQNAHIYNRGISGITSNELLEHIDIHILDMRPKQVFILVGTNDLERGGTPETIAKNIREICVTCQRECSDIEIYVLSIYPVNESSLFSDMVGKRTNKDICTANRLIAHTLSNVDSAHYVDLYASLLEDGQLNQRYTYDGLHLSIQGYRWVTDRLKTLVRHG